MTYSGTVRGSDGANIMNFNLQVKNEDGEIVYDKNYTNGVWMIDVQPGLEYWFSGMPLYGAILKTSFDLTQGSVIVIPKNFDAPTFSNTGKNIYYAGGLILLVILNERKKKSVGEIDTKNLMPLLLIGGAVIGFDLLKKLFESIGIWNSAETKQLDNQESNPSSYWNPNYYTQFSSYSYAIDTSQAMALAKQIYDSFGMFNDCEECVKSVFKSLRTKSNVSFLAKIFAQVYDQDLLSFLRGGIWPQDRLSDADVAEIDSYISKLPNN